MCRFRPLNESEKSNLTNSEICAEFPENHEVNIKSSDGRLFRFNFDRIFNLSSKQKDVYDFAAKPILESVLEGFNGTILTYGQTSSGKTFTMEGVCGDQQLEGIIPRIIKDLFEYIKNSTEDIEFTVKVSMVEIYMEKIKDLIEPKRNNLNIREDRSKGIYIEDLTEHYVALEEEVMELMKVGSENRTTGQTKMNEHSSRSHSAFIMTIYQNNLKLMIAKTGKLFLVDLAGSEKISKTGATGLTLEQAKNINKSLTTLGMVINSLTDGKSNHIPYRDSKLTRVLQESLGGNSKTCLIITCSPSVYNQHETISTLRFGERAKRIKNKPKINKEVTVAELKIEIENLEKIIQRFNKRTNQLYQFIENNGLKVPSEDDYTFLKENKIMENLTNLDIINDDSNNMIINNDNKSENSNNNMSINENNRNYLNIEDDDNIFNGEKYNYEDEGKKNISECLENAINKVCMFSLPLDEKNELREELEKIKNKHEMLEQHMYEKLNDLQERLDIEKNAINKSQTNSEKNKFSKSFNRINEQIKEQNEDKYNFYENENLFDLDNAEEDIIIKIKQFKNEINSKLLTSEETKIQNKEINILEEIHQNNYENLKKIKIIELFELIKNKLNINIPINYNFDNKLDEKNKNDKNNIHKDLFIVDKTDHQILVDVNSQVSNNNNIQINDNMQSKLI